MRFGMGFAVLGMLLVPPMAMAVSQVVPHAAHTEGGACPAPVRPAPLYPADMIEQVRGGTVLLDAGVDECGRVTQAEIKTSSGSPSLDQAALVAVREWIIGADDRARPAGGKVEIPVSFNMAPSKAFRYHAPDWPKSHKRPRYVLEEMTGYTSAQQVYDRYEFSADSMITPPYPNVHNVFFRQSGADPVEYWLLLYLKPEPSIAVRYRLVMENGEPVVRVAFVCDRTPARCRRDRKHLMKGLPFARAR